MSLTHHGRGVSIATALSALGLALALVAIATLPASALFLADEDLTVTVDTAAGTARVTGTATGAVEFSSAGSGGTIIDTATEDAGPVDLTIDVEHGAFVQLMVEDSGMWFGYAQTAPVSAAVAQKCVAGAIKIDFSWVSPAETYDFFIGHNWVGSVDHVSASTPGSRLITPDEYEIKPGDTVVAYWNNPIGGAQHQPDFLNAVGQFTAVACPGAPAPVDPNTLDGGNQGDVAAPASATAGAAIKVTVGEEWAGEEVWATVFSTPVSLGAFTVSSEGTITVTLPSSLTAGNHRLTVQDGDGALIGWTSISVAASNAVPAGNTGMDEASAATGLIAAGGLALVVLMAMGAGVAVRRHQSR